MSTFGMVGDASRALGTRVRHTVDRYRSLHDDERGHDASLRAEKSQELTNAYYDLVTDFYERGWGTSFHFAAPLHGETYREATARHEHYLALRLGLTRDASVLDVGSGVGGPARAIAGLSGAHVTGLNNNAYQVERSTTLTHEAGLSTRCAFTKGDFNAMPFPDASFDAAYQIEATAHAGDLVRVYREIHRVLRPGALFAGYEWCLLPAYDETDEEHRAVKKGIEVGDGLPDIRAPEAVLEALREAGFELVDSFDAAPHASADTPWYHTLTPGFDSVTRFRRSKPGRIAIRSLVTVLEAAKVAPHGTRAISETLHVGADALVRGGELGIFTPMFFTLARKK